MNIVNHMHCRWFSRLVYVVAVATISLVCYVMAAERFASLSAAREALFLSLSGRVVVYYFLDVRDALREAKVQVYYAEVHLQYVED